MQEMIPINIVIGDRSYRIRTSPKDEETVRKAVKTINDKIIEFKTQFAGKDMQDYIAMVLIWYATQVTSQPGDAVVSEDMVGKLKAMEVELDRALADKAAG